jgi:hypothetical protein
VVHVDEEIQPLQQGDQQQDQPHPGAQFQLNISNIRPHQHSLEMKIL